MECQTTVLAEVRDFVEQLITAGGTLARLVDGLAEALVTAGTPAESAENEIVEMLTGTVAVRLSSASEADLRRAAELMELALAAALADLHRALELAGEREAT
jgi:hypothetical protein